MENHYARQLQKYQSIPDIVFEAQGIRPEDRELCQREFSGASTFFRRPLGIEPAIEASRLRDMADRVQTYIVQRRERDAGNGLHNAEGLLHEYTLRLTDLGVALSHLSRATEQQHHVERSRVLKETFSEQKLVYAQLQARYHRIDTEQLEERDRNHFDLVALDEAFDESPLKTIPTETLLRRLPAASHRTKAIVQDPQRGYEVEDLLQKGEVLTEELHETLLWLERNVLGLEDARRRSDRKKRWDVAISRSGGGERRWSEDVGLALGSFGQSSRVPLIDETAVAEAEDRDLRQEHEETLAFINSLPQPDLGPSFAYRASRTAIGRAEERRRVIVMGSIEAKQAAKENNGETQPTAREGKGQQKKEEEDNEGRGVSEQVDDSKTRQAEAMQPELRGKEEQSNTKPVSAPSSEDSWYDCSSMRFQRSGESSDRSSGRSRSPPRFSMHSERSSRCPLSSAGESIRESMHT